VQTEADGAAMIAVQVRGHGTRTLLAFTDGTVASPAFVQMNRPSNWTDASHAHDWVAIAHKDFITALKPLAVQREREQYRAAIVDIEDVYDELSFGEKTPQALRDFLQHAQQTWRLAPKFVVLAGDATIDPRDYTGQGDADFVPTRQISMKEVDLETASDDWFVDFNDDGLPDIPIGRLSARTAAQAEAIVSKIVRYATSRVEPWARRVLLVADQDGDGSRFEASTSRLSALLPPDIAQTTLLRGATTSEAAHQALVGGINDGQLLVNYTGHGSVRVWGKDAGLLTADAAASFTNTSRPAFVVAMNCLTGMFNQVWD
jgi:hypothetical protein